MLRILANEQEKATKEQNRRATKKGKCSKKKLIRWNGSMYFHKFVFLCFVFFLLMSFFFFKPSMTCDYRKLRRKNPSGK